MYVGAVVVVVGVGDCAGADVDAVVGGAVDLAVYAVHSS